MKTLDPITQTLTYEILKADKKEEIKEAALCLAETFTGVQVGNALIREPMAHAANFSTEQFNEFTQAYLEAIVPHGLTVVAKDDKGTIVGVVAAEDFNPEEEIPVFDGELEPMNHIIQFLLEIDIKFVEKFEDVLKHKIEKGEFAHAFMVGVRLEKDKKHVASKMLETLAEVSSKMNYKGIFAEATNLRSEQLFVDCLDYYIPSGLDNKPITKPYIDHPVFQTIPHDIAKECAFVFKPFDKKYEI